MVNMPTIMVIEDETLLLDAISSKLKLAAYNVISCSSGKQALEILRKYTKLPNIIWLDYYLKDMNGLEFMNELKKDPKLQDLPVLIVSNSAGQDKVDTMLALGAKKYLLKAEHRLDEIIKMVAELIGSAK